MKPFHALQIESVPNYCWHELQRSDYILNQKDLFISFFSES